jgi:tRNA (adenine57-N1/adenine58-N1)-methyltransferase
MIKTGEFVLLISKDESYLVEVSDKEFNMKSGKIDLNKIRSKNFGDEISSHTGKAFVITKPTFKDILEKRVKRTAQVITPKDMGLILAYTGLRSDSVVVDAGTGSAYAALFLANFLAKGKVFTYENDSNFAKAARDNIRRTKTKNIFLKQADITKGIDEKDVDMVLLDLHDSHKVVKHAHKALRVGGWVVVYSPTSESLARSLREIKRSKFGHINTVECIVREWQSERTTRPKTLGLMHTGFITFARKSI